MAISVAPTRQAPIVKGPPASPFAWIVIVAGLAALGCSLLPFYTVTATATYDNQPYSSSFTGNAWYGVFGWLAIVLVAAGAIGAIVHLAGAKSRVAGADLAVMFSALGLATAIIAGFAFPSIENANLVAGRPWFSLQKLYGTGYWLSLICAIIAVGTATMTLLDTHLRAAANPSPAKPAPAQPAPAQLTQPWTSTPPAPQWPQPVPQPSAPQWPPTPYRV